ncbi:bifunctional methylenetetrahydrofolate dehydrogenase/methenyltetrahydrofolate cyclohydrolase FolD [Crassaminicella profunda]|uniref:bifunctional methylenetetrahydrofolate dehydrogenase/methenyltetrahydrofolate cyclohydrolase FolD n=1 Tax=Crassaminicella profunda TaxID=1286698 RepID=UPI001CA6A8A7|nr:bifunctional methylenetetrahydrofolate dehydrogenase/methenyltetrahydrofolate cyclohydrolase FolD [Crassaminicella profunda]QZY56957.1 bifunctional methylenetetrahydrofolate dehydrogenase/methenyltetrahydrofolate cyclohydrolase FolD [Crassaminicella profunda]
MCAKILDGRKISKEIRNAIMNEVHHLKDHYGITPGLAVVIVGDDDASHVYVSMKEKACQKVGFHSEVYKLPKETTEKELLTLIDELNHNEKINGILVQLPLPKGIDENLINSHILPMKDVDGFHAVNAGKLLLGEESFVPCTPKGILELIKRTEEDLTGKHAVVIGRSNIVGKPAGVLLLKENATVTICHSKTKNLEKHVKMADIVVAAVGVPELIKGDMIKDGAIVIDAGTRKVNGKLVGDVAFEEASKKASWITPVPGGVGPMTITMLLENTLKAAKTQCE